MPHVRRFALDPPADGWVLVAEVEADVGAGLAASPYAVPGFFAGWVAVGLLISLTLVARGHEARPVVGLGVGLGPLMAIVALDMVRRRDPAAPDRVLVPGIDRGGPLHVLVLADAPDDVRAVAASIAAVRDDIGTLTLARSVTYERADDPAEDDALHADRRSLVAAARLLPVDGARLALLPGTPAAVARRFRDRHQHALVLLACADPRGTATAER